MLKIIIWSCVLYLIYKFVFDLVVPIGKATSEMKQKINAMQQAQQQAAESQNNFNATSKAASSKTKPADEEYIDFEEMK
ncbi:MAG: hypothetical protein GTN67_13315 [Hydrotalea flava]|uniref:hypothetical protein n=1 Tax=Hydrotalea TaxID=1004300 RepID=UPI00082AF5E0|nr:MULTISPECIES: hypothetical protein [Hydrotalea]RTL54254.1 MAG: hypothetical protein EKK39_04805 [Sphingobacteriales bacterium]MBY0348575.1 hypothetical protein [Hydrotalea flava]NIM36286.1 hypothetical protein [Hydrotalea flava]NIM39137.1 hypothetical protein [Hydrotalea flava]NIN04372.1 hypothetical protein [Hydrotalea flava]